MNNVNDYVINEFIRAVHNGTASLNSSTGDPAGNIQASTENDDKWSIDKTYEQLYVMNLKKQLTGLAWHRSEDSIVIVPLTFTGKVDGHDAFVFSTIITDQGGSTFHSFIVPDEGEDLIYITEDVGVETSFEVVDELIDGHPKVDNPSTKIIYLYRDPSSTAEDPYTEWIYTRDGEWEIIGETSLDLSGYSTTEQIAENYYNKDEINNTVETINQTISDVSGDATEAIEELRSDKANKAVPQASGNLASLDGTGDLADSGAKVTSTYNGSDSVNPVTGSAVKSAIDALNIDTIESTTDKTVVSISETAGKVSATYGQISIKSAQVNDKQVDTYDGTAETLTTGKAVNKAISDTLAGLDSEITSSDGTNVQVKVTETDGKITAVNVTDNSINATDLKTAIDALDSKATSSDGTNVQVKVTETDGKISAVNITTDNTVNNTDLTNAINALDSEATSSDGTNVQVKVTEVDGVVTAVNVTTDNTVNSTDVDTAVTSAIGNLDVSDLVQDSSGSMAGKTLLTLNESDGKIAATFQDIQITESQVTGLTDDLLSKADKVSEAVDGHLAGLDSNGNLTDSSIPSATGTDMVSLAHTGDGYAWSAWESEDIVIPDHSLSGFLYLTYFENLEPYAASRTTDTPVIGDITYYSHYSGYETVPSTINEYVASAYTGLPAMTVLADNNRRMLIENRQGFERNTVLDLLQSIETFSFEIILNIGSFEGLWGGLAFGCSAGEANYGMNVNVYEASRGLGIGLPGWYGTGTNRCTSADNFYLKSYDSGRDVHALPNDENKRRSIGIHHLAVVVDRTANEARGYFDGELAIRRPTISEIGNIVNYSFTNRMNDTLQYTQFAIREGDCSTNGGLNYPVPTEPYVKF